MLWSLLRRGESPFASEELPPRTSEAIQRAFSTVTTTTFVTASSSACQTQKLLLRLHDGLEVETVLIPQEEFSTVCVSSQVGCRQACSFCATGTMGLLRRLTCDEILSQLFEALALTRAKELPPLRNVVFMGMGEPADNLEAVGRAVEVMTAPFGFNLAKKNICVSTVAPSPSAIRRLRPLNARLAWSVHAADDELRKLLVPTTSCPTAELRDAFVEVLRERRDRGLMIEVTLISDVNDQPLHAQQLVEFVAPLPGKTRVNLIPYNENAGLGAAGALFRSSRPEAVKAFQRHLLDAGLICTVRTTRGDGESAACGQLATRSRRQ